MVDRQRADSLKSAIEWPARSYAGRCRPSIQPYARWTVRRNRQVSHALFRPGGLSGSAKPRGGRDCGASSYSLVDDGCGSDAIEVGDERSADELDVDRPQATFYFAPMSSKRKLARTGGANRGVLNISRRAQAPI
jgi:hypothetical protein